MDRLMLTRFNNLFKRTKLTLPQLYATFYVQDDFHELLDEIGTFVSLNIEELADEEIFFDQFHLFLFNLSQNVKSKDDLYDLKNLIHQIMKSIKLSLKPYNKREIKKDIKYGKLNHFYKQLESNLNYLESSLFELNENNEFKIMWFLVNKLENPDYIFRIIEIYPNLVNVESIDGSSLFYKIIEYYLANIDQIDIKYYKRVIVLLLESDKLLVSNDELFKVLDILEKNLIHSNIEYKRHIRFVIEEINRHYMVLNVDSRCNAIDYTKKKHNIILENPLLDNRVDLTNLFTISVDSMNGNNFNNFLIDDAISIEQTSDGYNLYIHIPDVDEFIKRDTYDDEFMRNIGESIYAKDYKTPLINYEAAKKMSLEQGKVRPAITFRFKVDNTFKITNMDMMESIINVNYNFSKRKAQLFMDEGVFGVDIANVLNTLHRLAKNIRKDRKAKIGRNKKAALIIDEYNIMLDIYVAEFFNQNGIIFPYKNYFGLRNEKNKQHVNICNEFVKDNNFSDELVDLIYSIFNINNRVFYDTIAYPNHSFGGRIAGNVGNPLREYISLETLRLIKDLIIEEKNNADYWENRIEKDVIDYTETSAKVRELYQRV